MFQQSKVYVKTAERTYEKLGLGLEGSCQPLERRHAQSRLMLRHLTNSHKGAWAGVINRGSIGSEFTPRYCPCPVDERAAERDATNSRMPKAPATGSGICPLCCKHQRAGTVAAGGTLMDTCSVGGGTSCRREDACLRYAAGSLLHLSFNLFTYRCLTLSKLNSHVKLRQGAPPGSLVGVAVAGGGYFVEEQADVIGAFHLEAQAASVDDMPSDAILSDDVRLAEGLGAAVDIAMNAAAAAVFVAPVMNPYDFSSGAGEGAPKRKKKKTGKK